MRRVVFSCSSMQANMVTRSIATQRIELPLCGLDFGDVDVDIAEQVGFELALGRSDGLDVGQPGDVVSLQAAVER